MTVKTTISRGRPTRGVVGAALSAGRAATGVDLTAMIDVILLLVIFWMVVTTGAQASIDPAVEAPTAEAADRLVLSAETVVLTLRADTEDVLLAGRVYSVEALATALADRPRPSRVLLRADGATPARRSGAVLSALRSAGITQIAIATRRSVGNDPQTPR